MRKGILSLSLPGMRKRPGKHKAGGAAGAEQATEHKATVHEEPKVEAKAEQPLVQTIKLPKQRSSQSGVRRKNFLGGMGRKPRGKK